MRKKMKERKTSGKKMPKFKWDISHNEEMSVLVEHKLFTKEQVTELAKQELVWILQ